MKLALGTFRKHTTRWEHLVICKRPDRDDSRSVNVCKHPICFRWPLKFCLALSFWIAIEGNDGVSDHIAKGAGSVSLVGIEKPVAIPTTPGSRRLSRNTISFNQQAMGIGVQLER